MGGRDHSYECEQCGHERGGLNDVLCDCDMLGLTDKLEAMEALDNLASCLRWAGALCAAFNVGWDSGNGIAQHWPRRRHRTRVWVPGCGKAMR